MDPSSNNDLKRATKPFKGSNKNGTGKERKGKENTTLNAIINFTTVNNKLQIDEYLKTNLYLYSKLCTKLIIKNHNDLSTLQFKSSK